METSTLSPQQRRGALAGSSSSSSSANALHWTKSLGGSEHATSKLGARFHLRKLFLRSDVDELSQSELEFIVQYLVHETTIAEQPWWAALTHFERLEIVNALELHHVPKGEDHTLWFSSKETSKDCILLYGNADATPMDRNLAPVLKFTEGSVVGNMRLPTTLTLRASSHHDSDHTNTSTGTGTGAGADTGVLPDVAVSAGASAETWRRVKREQAFRNGLHHYNKLTVHGSADYFLLTSATILSTTSKAADRFQRQQLLQQFGLERFLGVIRLKTFESGAVLAQEDHVMRALYFIVEGECRASVRVDELIEQDPFAEKKLANEAATAMLLGFKPEPSKSPRKPTQLPIASLGPRSLVGDVSVLLGLREPATIQAVTAVTVLALSEEDYIKETAGDLRDPAIENMKTVALETMGFVLERVKAEALHQQCDQTKKIEAIEQSIAAKRSELGHRPEANVLFAQPARYQSLHNEKPKPQIRGSVVSTQRTNAPVGGKITSVVQKYAASVAASQNPRGGSTSGLGPIILSKRPYKSSANDSSSNSPTYWMTREQRKAALALSGLHSPLGAKSLGQLQLQQSNSVIQRRSGREEDDDEGYHDGNGGDAECLEEAESGRRRVTTIDDQLFLFPTMTRQRQLHARSSHTRTRSKTPAEIEMATDSTSVEELEVATTNVVVDTSVVVEEKTVVGVEMAAEVAEEQELIKSEETNTTTVDKTVVVKTEESITVETTTVENESKVEMSVDTTTAVETTAVVEMTEVEVVVSTTPPKAAKKNWGSFLPKVPAILLPKKDPATTTTTTSSSSDKKSTGSDHSEDDNSGEQGDELRSLTDGNPTDKPATTTTSAASSSSVPLASRLRGLSIEQNAFASSIVRKFNGFRSQSQSSNDSPRNSIDGVPGPHHSQQRRSLTGTLGVVTNATGNSNLPSPRADDPNAKARRGACVATKFGTGVVLDIRADDGFYIVQLVPKSIAYLRDDMVIREIKSVVGERVKTRWGLATVEQYYVDEDMYSIALDWRWDDDHVWRMKATTKKFEKIPKNMSIVQNTKNKLFEGYSTIRESASFGYANVAAKINTTASTYKAASAAAPRGSATSTTMGTTTTTSQQPHHSQARGDHLGKALTPYGICTVVEVRPDQFFVVQTKCGATAYLNADSVKLLHRRTNFAVGERVKTPYGTGEVELYRDEDEIYEIKLDFAVALGSMPPTLYISDVHAESMLLSANANAANYARLSSIFMMTRNSVYSASATVKASASGGLNTLSNVKSKVSTMAAIKMTKVKFQKGERVITSFGSGFVSDCRPLERIYEVQLRRLKFRGYFHESALTAFPYERVTHFIVDGKTIPAPEMPKAMPEHKRRNIINTAIRQARDGR